MTSALKTYTDGRMTTYRATISGLPRVAALQIREAHADGGKKWRAEFDRALFGDEAELVIDIAALRELAERLGHQLAADERATILNMIENTVVRTVAVLTGND